ncbi:senescence-associated protein-domain-containing protein [Phellopilus nigrolimitatus]|nr:senescence-associated protein-domain-containing protein [Phellopilus nigrolimitatus]
MTAALAEASSSATHPAHGAEGFLLLLLNNVEAWLPGAPTGIVDQLALECVTLPIPVSAQGQLGEEDERDVWLVLRVGPHEVPIAPTQIVHHVRAVRTFIFDGGGLGPAGGNSNWTIKLPEPRSPLDVENLDTFEVVLAQYAAVEEVDVDGPPPGYSASTTGNSASSTPFKPSSGKRPVPPPPQLPSQHLSDQPSPSVPPPRLPPRSLPSSSRLPESKSEADFKGRLVLVDEDDGEVVGTLGEQFHIREDKALRSKGHEKDPVVVDIPEYDDRPDRPTEVYIHPVPIEQQDTLMKTASLISRGLVFATNTLTTGFGAASSYYVAHSTPAAKPLVFSESTRGHVRRAHMVSGKAVTVTAKTTALIHEALEYAVRYASGSDKGKGKENQQSVVRTAPGAPPPPLPLRNRIFLSTDMLLTTVENSAKQLIEHGTLRTSEALGHKYGKDVGDASLLVGNTVRNVGIVYIDARGVGRRALLKKAGKSFIKAKLGHRDVVLGVDERGQLLGPQGAPPGGGGPVFDADAPGSSWDSKRQL